MATGFCPALLLDINDIAGGNAPEGVLMPGENIFRMNMEGMKKVMDVNLWGTLIGAMLPFALKKLRLDPATSSAPFVATLVDVTGIVIFFNVAKYILHL